MKRYLYSFVGFIGFISLIGLNEVKYQIVLFIKTIFFMLGLKRNIHP